MRRWLCLLPLTATLGCSNLDEGEAGIVALELQTPAVTTLEVGETSQLTAVALNRDGDAVEVPITWLSPDTTVSVDQTGLVTALTAGTGRVQASAGTLTSGLVTFTILAPADTLLIVGDSIVSVPAVPGTAGPLVVQLRTFGPPNDPLEGRPVVYEITGPTEALTSVVLTGGVLIDTLQTAADGTASVGLELVAGAVAPESTLVEVRASRTHGAVVPGSGQRFIVRYE